MDQLCMVCLQCTARWHVSFSILVRMADLLTQRPSLVPGPFASRAAPPPSGRQRIRTAVMAIWDGRESGSIRQL